MCNATFAKLMLEWDVNYTHNDKFREYVNANYTHHTNMYGEKVFSTEDMCSARKYWQNNAKSHPNYPWFKDYTEVGTWIENMPMGGYQY